MKNHRKVKFQNRLVLKFFEILKQLLYFTNSLVFIVLYYVREYIDVVLPIYSIIYIIIYDLPNFFIFSLISLFHLHYIGVSPVTPEKIGSKRYRNIFQ